MKHLQTLLTLLPLLFTFSVAVAGTTNTPSDFPSPTPAPTPETPLKLPAIIADHMVLQQKLADPIWGWDTPGTRVTVSFAGKEYTATAGSDGRWVVKLDPMPANATPQTMTITGSSKRELADILIGEVWMCSGQSNMEFRLAEDSNGPVEAASANIPGIRLITVPHVGTQELQKDFKGEWTPCNPGSAAKFSAVGFFFGRYLHQILNVPVGLINDSWGGSSAEAWVRRSSLEQDPRFKPLIERTVKRESGINSGLAKSEYEKQMAAWQVASDKDKAEGKPLPRQPSDPSVFLTDQHRPGNIFAGMVYPTLGYGIKGVIWYQGESNAGQAYEYNVLFPFLIEQWRKEQGQGDFPFYWVQLANYQATKPQPSESNWAELREAQTKTMQLTNTGQAVIIDLGNGINIHPRNKHDVAARLVRWALVKDYGVQTPGSFMPFRSPEFQSVAFAGNKATITIDSFGSQLRPFGTEEVTGFALCGPDQVWHWAKGKVLGKNQVEVISDEVPAPLAVRYAWADNPVCNLYSVDGLPLTPFRTDDFPISTAPKPSPQPGTAAQVAPLSPTAQASPGSVHSASLKTTNQSSTPAVIHP